MTERALKLLTQKGCESRSDTPPEQPPIFKKRPHNFQPTPEWFQYPRPDFYAAYDRGEKVGHLCRPNSGTAVMYHMLNLPRQPVETITVLRTRPKTALAVNRVEKTVPWIRVEDEETRRPVWNNRPKSAPCTRNSRRYSNQNRTPRSGRNTLHAGTPRSGKKLFDRDLYQSPVGETHNGKKQSKRPVSAAPAGRVGRTDNDIEQPVAEKLSEKKRPKSAHIANERRKSLSTTPGGIINVGGIEVNQLPNNTEDGLGNVDIDVKVERLQGFGGKIPGEMDNYGLVRLRERPPHIFQACPKDPSMRNPAGHREMVGPSNTYQCPAHIKNRYVRAFAKSCTKPAPVSYYEKRKIERQRRKDILWRPPDEHSYKPPLKAPCPCNPRKGIHPEASLSWFPAPNAAELGEKFAAYVDQDPGPTRYGIAPRKPQHPLRRTASAATDPNRRTPSGSSCNNNNTAKISSRRGPQRGDPQPIAGNNYKENDHIGECAMRAYGTPMLSFHALDQTRRRHHMLLVGHNRMDVGRSMKMPPHVPTLDC